MPLALRLVISGGQTGADRAGLDFAISAGLKHNGWCPRGRVAEDGFVPVKYNLRETESADYPQRTKKNVSWACATVIFSKRAQGKGTRLTIRTAESQLKPYLVLYTDQSIDANVKLLVSFLAETNPQVLNIAGSRESSEPGTYTYAGHVLSLAWNLARHATPQPSLHP